MQQRPVVRVMDLLRACCLAGMVLVFTGTAQANGFRNPPPGAKAQALDGGKTAFIDDPTAVTHNPANLAEITDAEVLGAATIVYAWTDFDSAIGAGSAQTRGKWHVLPSLYGAWPLQDGRWVAGLGISSPFGQSTEWAKDSPFKYLAPYFAELRTMDINPSIATRVGDNLTVGLGLQVMYSDIDLRQDIPWFSFFGAPLPDGRLRVQGDGWGVGGNVGATFKFMERQRLAVMYRLPMNVNYDGKTKVSSVPAAAGGLVAPRSDFETEIDFPQTVVLGYGIQARDNLRIGADVEWVQFSRFDRLPLDLGANNAAGLAPPSSPQNWDDIWTAGVAADWQYSENLALRGGYKFMESPIPDETHAPTLPDANRHLITLGLGYTRGSQSLDLAYAYSIFENRNVRTSPVAPFNGDYDLTSHLFVVSYNYKF